MSDSTKETIIAFVRLLCMFVTSALALFGVAVDADILYIVLTVALAGVVMIWSWWKNNNVTKAASDAQAILDMAKAEKNE